VSGGRISALGDDRGIREHVDSSTTVIDLKGAVVTPGLVDGHLHPVSGAELTHGLDLSGCNWSRRLGEERASRAWRCRDLRDSGATVVLGSDWPIAPYPPLGVMAGARHRRPSRDLTQDPHGPEQALTPLEALQGLTVNAAYAAGEEHEAGRIAVGYRADLTVLADNPLTTADMALPDLPVLLTVLNGRPTYRDASL
jgi:predicted amidohydrolase YtcJ